MRETHQNFTIAYAITKPITSSAHEQFIEDDYKRAFESMKRRLKAKKCKMQESMRKRLEETTKPPCCKVASSCEINKCRKPSKPKECEEHQHCVTKEKYPCCDHDSDEEEPCRPPKKGFFGKCCPCCVSTKAPVSKCQQLEEESRPCSSDPYQNRRTQTTTEDFQVAKKAFKEAMIEERKRQKMYGKKAMKDTNECTGGEQAKPKRKKCKLTDKEKNEAKYRLARDKYRQRRKKMEQSINKQLEREMKKRQKDCPQ